jgi:hypothetical protein
MAAKYWLSVPWKAGQAAFTRFVAERPQWLPAFRKKWRQIRAGFLIAASTAEKVNLLFPCISLKGHEVRRKYHSARLS